MGVLLILLGAGVVLWTVVEIFQLFTHGSAFIVLDEIVPAQIEIVKKSRTLRVTVRYSEVDFKCPQSYQPISKPVLYDGYLVNDARVQDPFQGGTEHGKRKAGKQEQEDWLQHPKRRTI